MRVRALVVGVALALAACGGPRVDQTVTNIDGQQVSLKEYRGKALLIVNVASECGYTPQYADLQKLYEQYKGRGLVVLGFPSNEFGSQEPGDRVAIKAFATQDYGVTFPLFDKVETNGPNACPLYKTLTAAMPREGAKDAPSRGEAQPVKWNFEKFVVDTDGKVVARFGSKTTPLDPKLLASIESVLPKNAPKG